MGANPSCSESSVDLRKPPAKRWLPVIAAFMAYIRPVVRVP